MKSRLSILMSISLLALVGCGIGFKGENSSESLIKAQELEAQLKFTGTGQQSLGKINELRNNGYEISYNFTTSSEISNLNGHNGGGYAIEGGMITIYINKDLPTLEQLHVLVHEISHIRDDLEVQQFLLQYPHVETAANNFVEQSRTFGINAFPLNVSKYVLQTLFCSEVRAYTANQNLANEGTSSQYFVHGNNLVPFINQNYIARFGTSMDPNGQALANWCLSNSMTTIQKSLVW